MRKKIIKGLAFLLLFAASFLVVKYFTDKSSFIANLFMHKDGSAEQTSKWKTVLDGVLAFGVANVFNFIRLYFEWKKEGAAGAPYILLKKLDETLIRKDVNRDGTPEIVIGQGKYFVYVTVRLENTGEGAITGCKVAGQRMQLDRIGSHESVQFRFRICRKKDADFQDSYHTEIAFEDERGRSYLRRIGLRVNGDAHKPEIEIEHRGKQRRIRA